MIVVEKSTNPNDNNVIVIGRQCETGVTQIQFDLSYLIETYGNGSAVIVHQRSQDVAPYIVSDYERGDGIVTWTIDDVDTLFDGCGHCELRWTVNDALAKTVVYKTITIKSITGDTEIPTALQSWYDAMIEYIDTHSVDPEDIYEAVEAYMEQHPISGAVISVNNKTGEVTLTASDVGALPDTTVIPSKTSDLTNDSGFIAQETDPTVPAWAKSPSKPSYTASEVGALPSSTAIPTKTSDLQNDSGFGTYSKPSGGIPKTDLSSAVQTSLGKADTALQSYTETDPTVPSWAKAAQKPTYTAQEVGALPSSTVIPSVDNTLTVTGAAADAKKTGDEIADLKSELGDLSDLETTAKTDLVSAINEVAQSGGGSIEIDPTLSIEGDAADAKAAGDEINDIKAVLARKKDADITTVTGQDSIEVDSAINTTATSFVVTLPYNSNGYTDITVLNPVDLLQKDYAKGGWEVTAQNVLQWSLANDIYRFNNPIDVIPGETLTLAKHLCIYANATNTSDRENTTGNLTYIVPSGASQIGCRIFKGDFSAFNPDDYTVVRSNSITVDLSNIGATVYGGSVDIASGTVISTKNADGTERTTPDVYNIEQQSINIPEGVSVFNCTGFELSITYPTASDNFKKPSDIYIVAPSDATDEDKMLADYVCSGTNDELTIQQAVDHVGAQGTVVLLDGNYYIDNFYTDSTSDACSTPSAIYVKKSKNVQSLTIMGLTEGGGEQAWTCGAILHVKSSSAGSTQSSVFNVSTSYVNVDYFTVNFANFKILVDTVNYPVVCINTEYIGASQIRNIRLKGGNMTTGSSSVPVQGMIGIKGQTGWGAGTGQKWAQCGAYGFYEGFAVGGEHLTCENLLARYCVYGYTINNYNYNHGSMSHPIVMLNCADELNCHLPLFNKNGSYNAQTSNARQPVYIIGFTIEWRPGQIPGLGTPEAAEEVTPGAFSGIVEYVLNTNESTNALDMPFWKSGSGIGFKTRNTAHRLGGTTSERTSYAPTFMQTYYDTSLNKLLIYDGSAWRDANGTTV